MAIPVPTLSTGGWISDVGQKADSLLSYFLVNDANQTVIAWGRVHSMPQLLQSLSNMLALANETQRAINTMFQPHFDAVDVSVTTGESMDLDGGSVEMRISIIVTDGGKKYSVGHLLTITNRRITRIIKE